MIDILPIGVPVGSTPAAVRVAMPAGRLGLVGILPGFERDDRRVKAFISPAVLIPEPISVTDDDQPEVEQRGDDAGDRSVGERPMVRKSPMSREVRSIVHVGPPSLRP
jgi:hypothetical protein